ncbi:MAG: hypothetical protein AAF085_08450 [Planctomycetota bacterium]
MLNNPYAIRDGNRLINMVEALPFYVLTPMLIGYCHIVPGASRLIRILATILLVVFLSMPMTWQYTLDFVTVLVPHFSTLSVRDLFT